MAGTVVKNPVPDMTTTIANDNGVYTVNFNSKKNAAGEDITTGTQVSDWASKVTKVIVNRTEYPRTDSSLQPNKDSANYKINVGSYGGRDFVLGGSAFKDSDNTIVISATGYENLTFTITKEATPVTKTAPKLTVTNISGSSIHVHDRRPFLLFDIHCNRL